MVFNQLSHRVVRNSVWPAFTAAALFALIGSTQGLAETPTFESEPTLQYSQFHGVPAASGSDYRIATEVPVSGYYGQFNLHSDLGDMPVDGVSLLEQRVREIQPTIELKKLSSSKVFTDALGKSAQSGVESVGRAIEHPVETAKNVPAGIGRFFKSVGSTVQGVATPDKDGGQSAAVADAVGINKAKRSLAEKVGVDPYTTNPYLARRLNELAQAAVAGGITIDVALAVTTGGAAMIVSATKTVSNLAWSMPPEGIRELNDKDLTALGVESADRKRLLDNRWYTPTMALSFVEAMKALNIREGASAFVGLAAGAQSEIEARFYITQLRLAHRFVMDGNHIESMTTRARIGAFHTKGGGLFVPAPLDYLTWTEDVQAVVNERKEAKAAARTLWLTGKASPKATEELRRAGWHTRFEVGLAH